MSVRISPQLPLQRKAFIVVSKELSSPGYEKLCEPFTRCSPA